MSESKRARVSLDEIQVNKHLGRSRKPKGGRTRRTWTDGEEEILCVTLKDLVCNCYKSDNGFRSGYLQKIEDAIKRECPNSDIKATPHVVSKITAWKRAYGLLQGILSRSGIGFNAHGTYKIDCSDEQWEQIVKADSNTRFMRGKSWPYWEEWQVIFGKDRTGGVAASDVDEMETDVDNEASPNGIRNTVTQSMNLDDISTTEPVDQADDSTCNSSRSRPGGSKSVKKAKEVPGVDGLIDMLAKLHNDTNSRLDRLTARIGYEFDLSKARKQVYQLLSAIPALTRTQKFDAGVMTLAKGEHLDFFLSLPEEDRHDFVIHALERFSQ